MGTEFYIIIMVVLTAVMVFGLYINKTAANQGRVDAGRRSFLKGSGANDGEHALFFGIQLVIQIFGSDELRARLARLVQAEDDTDDANEKRRFIKSVASLLIENRYAWEYGFWDYYSDAETAISTFNQWKNEIEASMATEPEELGEEIDRLHRFSDQKEFLVVTIMMLIDNREEPVGDDVGDVRFRATYSQLTQPFRGAIDGISEDEYWEAATFEKLLDGLQSLDPRAIERDGMYVYPGTAQDGMSTYDLLSDEGWKYITDHSFRLK